MAKKSLLLVDADPRSLRVLEVSLRKAGYSVATCQDARSALETVDLSEPDLILSDTRLPGINGFTLVEELRKRDGHQNVPFMFLSSDSSVESKVRGLELGVEDYLTKPIYIKEIITRINLTLQRQEREGLAKRTSISKTRFTGSLGDMGLVDLLQTIDISRKSGVLELTNEAIRGTISFRDGQLVDAELGRLVGESAIYRLLLWNEGEFEIDFRPVRVEQRVRSSTQAILMEGMRRIDEWGRLLEQIPSLDNVFEVSDEELMERLAEIPDEINRILKHIDGRRSLIQVVDACEGDDLETLTAITKLYFEGIVFPTGRTSDGTDALEDELLVGAHSESSVEHADSVPPGPDLTDLDADAALVPRSPTMAPPALAEDRENANAPEAQADTNVSVRAELSEPEAARLAGDPTDALGGMGTAPPPPAFAASGPLEAGAAHDDALSEDLQDSEEPDEEDGMARKGRRRRSKRAKTENQSEVELQEESLEQESANNVIQFPAQAKRGIASSQVAVNDVVGVEDSVEGSEPEALQAREDATQTVKRDEPYAPPEAQAEAHAEEAPAPEATHAEAAPPEAPAQQSEEPANAPREEDAAETAPAEMAPAEMASAETETASTALEPAEPGEAESPEAEAGEPASKAPETPAQAQPAPSPSDEPRGRRKKKKSKKARQRQSSRPPAPAEAGPRSMAEPAVEIKSTPPGPREIEAVKPAAAEEAPRPKKDGTTSAEIRAVAMTGEHQAVAEDFFRTNAKPAEVAHETWDDLEKDALPLPEGMKTAKYATFAIGALGLLLIGGYVVYQNFIMPQPVALSGGAPPELPTITDTDEPSTSTAPPEAETPEAETPEAETPEGETPTLEGAEPVAEGEALVAEGEEPIAEGEEPIEGEEPVAEVAPPEVAPVEVAPVADVDARQLAQQALRALNRRRNDEAADLAGRAVAADQTVALGWLVLGAARQELRDVAGAREAYQSCIEHGQGREVRDCRAMLR